MHCAAGVSRSSTVVIAYIMAKYNINFDEALLRVREVRQCVNPNNGFANQLRRLNKELLKSWIENAN